MELTSTATLSPAFCFRSHSYFISFNNPPPNSFVQEITIWHITTSICRNISPHVESKSSPANHRGHIVSCFYQLHILQRFVRSCFILCQAPQMVLLVLRNCFLCWFWFRQFLLTPHNQQGVWAGRSWQQTQPGQLTSTDQRDITYHLALCSAYKAGRDKEEEGMFRVFQTNHHT